MSLLPVNNMLTINMLIFVKWTMKYSFNTQLPSAGISHKGRNRVRFKTKPGGGGKGVVNMYKTRKKYYLCLLQCLCGPPLGAIFLP